MSKRAERRFHLRRMKAKARKAFSWIGDPKRAEQWANNMAMCSRHCCGNPRKWWKETTRKEQEADLNFKEQKKGLDLKE